MKTKLRKEINEEKWNRLLLSEASSYQIFRQFHKSHTVTMVECAIVSGVIGWIIGTVL